MDSGSALFAGSAGDFVRMAPESSLTAHLTKEFNRRWGTASESEIKSWRQSLTALASVIQGSALPELGVGVELKLPLSSKRIDVSLVGRGPSRDPGVVLVELKQWSGAAPSQSPDNVIVGGKELLHPSVQVGAYAAYLRESHSAFTEHGFGLAACSYLHGMATADSQAIRGISFAGALAEAPMFTLEEGPELRGYLENRLSGGGGTDLLDKLVKGRFQPSKKLMDGIAQALRETPRWTLLDEQRLAFNIVRGLVERASAQSPKAVVIVSGGPGTGKSVVAAHLLTKLGTTGGRSVCHATGSKAFTTNLRAIAPRGGSAVFKYFNNFRPADQPENGLDVVICDEAHRLRETSNDRFTPAAKKSGISQTAEIIRAAKVSVFFLDERQNVRPGEQGTVEGIQSEALSAGAQVHRLALDGQFRCSGCSGYVDWVESLLSDAPGKPGEWHGSGEYELQVASSVEQLEALTLSKNREHPTARLVAGFCWPWSDPTERGELVPDVEIGSWRRPWNAKPPEQRRPARPQPAAKKHPYFEWASDPNHAGEVGCIYTAQGFEFDYCGVILGPDLVWREGSGWVASREGSRDPSIARRKLAQSDLRALLCQTYRVLLTRGMKGTFVYSVDWETQAKLSSLIEQVR